MPFSWDNFPYTNFHELNLDWFIKKFKEIFDEWESLYTTLTQWKEDTDTDLAQWKEDTLSDMETWENNLLDALDEWKAATGEDIGEWEAGIISDLNDWKDDFNTAFDSMYDRVDAIVSDTESMVNNLASPFSTSNSYKVGDYVVYQGILYRFKNDHAAGAWSADDVTATKATRDTLLNRTNLTYNDDATIRELNWVENNKINNLVEIPISEWIADSTHGYGFIMKNFLETSLVDKIFIGDYAHYRAYINYYDETFERVTYIYISNNEQHVINKTYKYFKIWVYNVDTDSTETVDIVTAQVKLEKYRVSSNITKNVRNFDDNVYNKNGVWNQDLTFEIMGLSLASNRVGQPIYESFALTRVKTQNPLYINHDNAFISSGFLNDFPMMYAKVDENNTLLAYGGYSRSFVLNKGIYYLLFKNSSGSAITEQDLTDIADIIKGYSYFDENLDTVDYSKLFGSNWYSESGGVVSLGDTSWNRENSALTTVVIPPFYTSHDIYISNSEHYDSYQWRDSVSDVNNNIIYSTGYIATGNMVKIPAGYHHIMVSRRYSATPVDYSIMSTCLKIYATTKEISSITSDDVINRNIDVQNSLNAILKPDKYSSGSTRTIFLAQATDSHGDIPRWKNFLKTIGYYNPELIVHTGDLLKEDYLSDKTYFYNNLPPMPTLLAIGNHEVGAGEDIGSGGATNLTLFTNLIQPLNTKYGLNATKTYYSYTTRALAYTGGIKFIVLNVYDYDAHTGNEFADREHIYYSQDQIDWLITELQSALTNNNPVVICAHECDKYLTPSDGGETPFNQTYQLSTFYSKTWSGNPICDLIEAFIDGDSINQTYTETGSGITLTVNTTFGSAGHFVCWLVGHRHADYMGFLDGYKQLVISPCATACSISQPNSAQGYSDLPRKEGERCEDAFNLYAITPDAKTIGIVRIGSNINYELRDRKNYVTSYVQT